MLRITLPEGRRIRALVVDDSVVIRRLVTLALQEDPSIEVVGSASNGAMALQKISQLNPDLVTLDIEMPEMSGLEALKEIRKQWRNLVVIMFSTLTSRGASATMDALALGANDYVMKASNEGSLDKSIGALRGELIPKVQQFFTSRVATKPVSIGVSRMGEPESNTQSHRNSTPAAVSATTFMSKPAVRFTGLRRAVAIGISTGGPSALAEIFPKIPANINVPIFLVQHMPPMFTKLLAERLSQKSQIAVVEAEDGMIAMPGTAYLAPGNYHLTVRREGAKVYCALNQDPQENSCRPAVDVLFRSIERVYGGGVVAAVLTGMGQDGLKGVEALRPSGAYIIAQDEQTSVVWGMPGAVANAGLADSVVGLSGIVPEIIKRLNGM